MLIRTVRMQRRVAEEGNRKEKGKVQFKKKKEEV